MAEPVLPLKNVLSRLEILIEMNRRLYNFNLITNWNLTFLLFGKLTLRICYEFVAVKIKASSAVPWSKCAVNSKYPGSF